MNNDSKTYDLIAIGTIFAVGAIQTAIVVMTFFPVEWLVGILLIACVWIAAVMDGKSFHHLSTRGGNLTQKVFLGAGLGFMVIVLAIDIVTMFHPDFFIKTDDPIVKTIGLATGINIAFSIGCVLGFGFFSEEHTAKRAAAERERAIEQEERDAYLQSEEGRRLIGENMKNEMRARYYKAGQKYVMPPEKPSKRQPFIPPVPPVADERAEKTMDFTSPRTP